jgi:predicted nucleotidyltransferase
MDKAEVIEHVKRYAAALSHELPVTQVILFGSYVIGQPHEDSDIDVAVVVKEISEDYLTLITHLYALATPIDPMIEPHLLLEDGNNSGFLEEVQRTGEVIYRAA